MGLKKLRITLPSGRTSFALLDTEVGVIDAYCLYMNSLVDQNDSKLNTIKSVAQDLKIFFEYLHAFNDPTELNALYDNYVGVRPSLLSDVIHQFPHYLSHGDTLEANRIAHLAATKTQRKPTQPSTNQRILSSVNGFLHESAAFQAESLHLEQQGIIRVDLDPDIMFGELLERKELSATQRHQLLKRSFLAGVLRGGARFAFKSVFRAKGKNFLKKGVGAYVEKALPHKYALPLLKAARCERDRCYWSLELGTGLRPTEGLAVLLEDIDFENRTVDAVDPRSRPLSYLGVDPEILTYKARDTPVTFFIEPFRSIFFESLHRYLTQERAGLACDHNLLFVVLKGKTAGRPMLMGDMSTPLDAFHDALNNISAPKNWGRHSMRHFYGVHCVNYLPVAKGQYGLSLNTVQQLMGHAIPESTEVYTKPPRELLQAKLEYANKLIERGGGYRCTGRIGYL